MLHALFEVGVAENRRHFRACEFRREFRAAAQQFADFGAAERQAMLRTMRTSFFGSNAAAFFAVERGVEAKRRDAELIGRIGEEFLLRIEGTVKAANTGVVTADNEVRASVIFAGDGMENGFARAGVAHSGGIDAEDGARGREGSAKQGKVAPQTDFRGDVFFAGIADERMEEQAVDGFECTFQDIFVREMNGIAGLKRDDGFPAMMREKIAGFPGIEAIGFKRAMIGTLEKMNAASEAVIPGVSEICDPGMRVTGCGENLKSFTLAVVGKDFFQFEDGDELARGAVESDGFGAMEFTGSFLADRKRDGDGPDDAV